MKAEQMCKELRIAVTPDQALSMRYLEKHGQRFAIDFGYGNAIEKARELKRQRRRNAQLQHPSRREGRT